LPDHHYVDSRLAALYDLDSGWSADRDFYLALADDGVGSGPLKILDLGCGTGLLCNAYAERGHSVTGVDPSAAMLALGRVKVYGDKIEWLQATAQSYRSDSRFDLIIMTGHAFQVLLSDDDLDSTFATMRDHLKEDGRIVFESRNPLIDWASRWDYEVELQLPEGSISRSVVESRHFRSMQDNLMSFELRYRFAEEELVSRSQLRFMTAAEITTRLCDAALVPVSILGGWSGQPFDPLSSEEMIFTVEKNSFR
jgi:SAM-dependent methyltransferase